MYDFQVTCSSYLNIGPVFLGNSRLLYPGNIETAASKERLRV